MKLILIMLLPIAVHAKTFPVEYPIEWHRCYDGDTCTISLGGLPDVFGKKIGLRVWGIDTPEIRGKCAKEKRLAKKAQRFVWKRVKNGKATIHNIGRGKYFRIVGRVKVGDKWLDDLLFDAGLGVRYYGKKKTKDWCVK